MEELGEPVREIRRYKLETYFRMFRVVTEAIDPNYIPEMARLFMKEGKDPVPGKTPRLIPEKVGSAYLYDYLQSGLRVVRFQIRMGVTE